jgi:hypothetical protein
MDLQHWFLCSVVFRNTWLVCISHLDLHELASTCLGTRSPLLAHVDLDLLVFRIPSANANVLFIVMECN